MAGSLHTTRFRGSMANLAKRSLLHLMCSTCCVRFVMRCCVLCVWACGSVKEPWIMGLALGSFRSSDVIKCRHRLPRCFVYVGFRWFSIEPYGCGSWRQNTSVDHGFSLRGRSFATWWNLAPGFDSFPSGDPICQRQLARSAEVRPRTRPTRPSHRKTHRDPTYATHTWKG